MVYTARKAMRRKSIILKYIIGRWNESFVGTSALELADEFNLTHSRVIKQLKILVDRDVIYLRNTQLWQPVEFY